MRPLPRSRLPWLWDSGVRAAGGQLCPGSGWLWVQDERPLHLLRWASPAGRVGLPAAASPSLLLRTQILPFLTPPKPAVLSRAKTAPLASRWPGASSTSRILCLSFWNAGSPHPAAPLLPIAVGFVLLARPLFTALSLSLSTLPSCLAAVFSPLSRPLCPFCSPHGLSCRGASTSPTSACHLRSE